jgi:hypothetical protein
VLFKLFLPTADGDRSGRTPLPDPMDVDPCLIAALEAELSKRKAPAPEKLTSPNHE